MATLEEIYLTGSKTQWRRQLNQKIYLALKNHEPEFNQTFDRPITDFCNTLGFDLLKFLHAYFSQSGASYDTQIKQQYGDAVAAMINELAKVV